jgi:hypothetical protein
MNRQKWSFASRDLLDHAHLKSTKYLKNQGKHEIQYFRQFSIYIEREFSTRIGKKIVFIERSDHFFFC